MRQIHPLGWHERFVASGTYHWFGASGERVPDSSEQWTVHALPDGAQIIRADRQTRDEGVTLAHLWRSPLADGGRIERATLMTYPLTGKPSETLRTEYTFEPTEVRVSWSRGRDATQEAALTVDEGYAILFPVFAANGEGIARAAEQGASQAVRVCPPNGNGEVKLSPQPMSVRYVYDEVLDIGGRAVEARVYSDGVDDAPRNWIDRKSIILRQIDDPETRIELTHYVRTRDAKS